MRAVFLDRDGVINENRADHVKTWSEFRFLPGAIDAIARLAEAAVPVFVITNQAIVNRGVAAREIVEEINARMVREIERAGGRIAGIAYCPHRPDERCVCRKPQPGLLTSLAGQHGVDLHASTLIGDALTDIQAGRAAGCDTMLVLTGRGRAELGGVIGAYRGAIPVANSLHDAVQALLQQPSGVA